MTTIAVNTPQRRYEIRIGPGILPQLGAEAKAIASHARALLVVDGNIRNSHGEVAARALGAAGYELAIAEIEAKESRKSLETARELYDAMLEARLERTSPVIALGGGLTCDVAGFAAATFLRGLPLIMVPTTLLAMVDAAIGGKTAVNFPLPAQKTLGKNLIGAFWQPALIVIDPNVLATLPQREFRCGLAECVKHGLIADPVLLDFLEESAQAILTCDSAAMVGLITRSARVKVAIVEQDPHEAGPRAVLNLGHTFAHAIESVSGQKLKHGEAVAIGLVAAMRCAAMTGRFSSADEHRVIQLLVRLELPVKLSEGVHADDLMKVMQFDKKVRDDRVRLVLPSAMGRAGIVDDVPEPVVRASWQSVGVAS